MGGGGGQWKRPEAINDGCAGGGRKSRTSVQRLKFVERRVLAPALVVGGGLVPAAVVAVAAATATTATTATPVAVDHQCGDYANDEHYNHDPNPTGDDERIAGFFHKIRRQTAKSRRVGKPKSRYHPSRNHGGARSPVGAVARRSNSGVARCVSTLPSRTINRHARCSRVASAHPVSGPRTQSAVARALDVAQAS